MEPARTRFTDDDLERLISQMDPYAQMDPDDPARPWEPRLISRAQRALVQLRAERDAMTPAPDANVSDLIPRLRDVAAIVAEVYADTPGATMEEYSAPWIIGQAATTIAQLQRDRADLITVIEQAAQQAAEIEARVAKLAEQAARVDSATKGSDQ